MPRRELLAFAFLLGWGGCSIDPLVRHQDDFEACGDLCGYEPSAAGRASIVATIHPGEHGLRLEGEVVVTRMLDAPTDFDSIAWVEDGPVDVAIYVEVDGATELVPLTLDPPKTQPDGTPIEPAKVGFHPAEASIDASRGGGRAVGFAFTHRASSAPVTIDEVRLLAFNTSPGCY